MRVREQLIGAAILATATYYGILRIAEAKCDAAVGSLGTPIDQSRPEDLAAFERLRQQLFTFGQGPFADRLEDLRRRHELWVAPGLGPDRWAAYVEALGLVRRIYIRRVALMNPRRHLYPADPVDVPTDYQSAFAWLGLGGAMRHELAHHDGAIEEAEAYRIELAWYEEIRRSAFLTSLEGDERARWEWAFESAIASARKAAERAGPAAG
ncbi:MAG: hypothetical protein K1Y01_22020 [Vicinamibacteria bacterium]|nr:hypothetical protein [Vicinamibacteria bacterium]